MSSKRQIGRARVFYLQNQGHITTENDFPAVHVIAKSMNYVSAYPLQSTLILDYFYGRDGLRNSYYTRLFLREGWCPRIRTLKERTFEVAGYSAVTPLFIFLLSKTGPSLSPFLNIITARAA